MADEAVERGVDEAVRGAQDDLAAGNRPLSKPPAEPKAIEPFPERALRHWRQPNEW